MSSGRRFPREVSDEVLEYTAESTLTMFTEDTSRLWARALLDTVRKEQRRRIVERAAQDMAERIEAAVS